MSMKWFRGCAWLFLIAALSGCSTPLKMMPRKADASIDMSAQSFLLASLTLGNRHHPSFIPDPISISLRRIDGRQKPELLSYAFDGDAEVGSPARHYLIRIPLAPGRYELLHIQGTSGVFPIRGFFFLPLSYELEVEPGRAEYLGHIDATVVERKEGELRAGPPIPLIDQAVSGFSTGTWEVALTDASQTDITEFKAVFPSLSGLPIGNRVLPPWDKAKEDARWRAQ